MSVADEIRRLQMKKSAELQARERRAAKHAAKGLESQLQTNRAPGSMYDPGFVAQLDRKAHEARERAGESPRPDLDSAIEQARLKGHLPPAHEGKMAYEPTAEEILGDEALPKPPARPSENVEELPSAEDVLNGDKPDESASYEAAGYKPGPFSPEELAEIDRLNPKPKGVAPEKQIRQHSRDRHYRRR